MDLLNKIEMFIGENTNVRAVRTKLNKEFQSFSVKPTFNPRRSKDGSWVFNFGDIEGAMDDDPWRSEITIYLEYDATEVWIEVYNIGNDKRGRTDSENLASRTMKIKDEESLDKIVKYIKNMAKKHFKVKL